MVIGQCFSENSGYWGILSLPGILGERGNPTLDMKSPSRENLRSPVKSCLARSPYSPLCKIQGTDPQISRFFLLFLLFYIF